jgi:AmmeMemoRadiSam system protein B
MKIRESSLPAGWYPRNPDEIGRFLSEWSISQGSAHAALAPHAGWYYSGKIAARALSSLDRNIETLAIIGGHLSAGYPPLFALEDSVSTPQGAMNINAGLRDALRKEIGGQEDRYPDNTVEVLLPMARFFFPEASLLWLRLPAELSSFDAGRALSAAAAKLGCSMAVLASTDLTHYGPNYGFSPKGRGVEALRWVREVNDRCFINAVESGDPADVLEQAEKDSSSCSVGAVLCAMGFISARNIGPARLLEYGTSADVETERGLEIPDSFVGYAAMASNR